MSEITDLLHILKGIGPVRAGIKWGSECVEIYVVNPGDNVDEIAARAGIPVETLIFDNQIPYPYRLAVGQALILSNNRRSGSEKSGDSSSDGGAAGQVVPGSSRLYVSGYGYPFIRQEVLQETLPFLTAFYVFSYGFTAEGELVPPMTDDAAVLQAVGAARVRPVLTLTSIGLDGRFHSSQVHLLVTDFFLQRKVLLKLGQVMVDRGFEGLDIDFEYVEEADRLAFSEFVRRAAGMMNQLGFPVSVALAPKTSAGQRGLLYEGIDYQLLGAAANRAMLMTYEWGYSQGPPMAVAPIHMVRRVAEYALTEIPSQKISLGIPNYGYDWPLPYIRGQTRARTLHSLEAIQLAIDHGVEIRFDEQAQTPYFRYWQYGIQHEVWFEDPRSLYAKFRLVKELGFSGVGYWTLMNFYRPNWLLLTEMFEVESSWE